MKYFQASSMIPTNGSEIPEKQKICNKIMMRNPVARW